MIYTVVLSTSFNEFLIMINDQLKNKWECQGGIIVRRGVDEEWFYQAMVRKEYEIEDKTPEYFEKQHTMDLLWSLKNRFNSKEYAKIEKDIEGIEPRYAKYINSFLRYRTQD